MISVTDSLASSGVSLNIAVNALTDAFINRYEIEYRLSGAAEWVAAGNGASVSVPGVLEGQVYEVRARGINMLGMASPWANTMHQVLGSGGRKA